VSFDEFEFKEERHLEHYMMNNPECIEEGLKVLGHQVPTVGGKRIDILALDSEGRLVVIELKLFEDDRMLMQGVEYIDWVNENADRIAEIYKTSKLKIDPKTIPELVLVAPSFSRTLRTAAKYVSKDYCYLSLMEYVSLKDSTGKKGLFCREITIKPIERPIERWDLEDYLDYFDEPKLKKLFQDIISEVKNIGSGIECNPTQSWYVALQYKGRNLCTLSPRKKYFYLWIRGDEEFQIRKSKDFTQEIREKIIGAYKDLGGKLKAIL
jgi:hypothetical protein